MSRSGANAAGPYVVDGPDPLSEICEKDMHSVGNFPLREFTKTGTGKDAVLTMTKEFTSEELACANEKRIAYMNEAAAGSSSDSDDDDDDA